MTPPDDYMIGQIVFAAQDITMDDLYEDGDPSVIVLKGTIGMIGEDYLPGYDNVDVVFFSMGGEYTVLKSMISLDRPIGKNLPPLDPIWLLKHIRDMEEIIRDKDDFTEGVMNERDNYLEAFKKLNVSAGIATKIGRGDICPKCFCPIVTLPEEHQCDENMVEPLDGLDILIQQDDEKLKQQIKPIDMDYADTFISRGHPDYYDDEDEDYDDDFDIDYYGDNDDFDDDDDYEDLSDEELYIEIVGEEEAKQIPTFQQVLPDFSNSQNDEAPIDAIIKKSKPSLDPSEDLY